jgi:hypothetical protein
VELPVFSLLHQLRDQEYWLLDQFAAAWRSLDGQDVHWQWFRHDRNRDAQVVRLLAVRNLTLGAQARRQHVWVSMRRRPTSEH